MLLRIYTTYFSLWLYLTETGMFAIKLKKKYLFAIKLCMFKVLTMSKNEYYLFEKKRLTMFLFFLSPVPLSVVQFVIKTICY